MGRAAAGGPADGERRWPPHRRFAARYAVALAAVALGSTLLVAVPTYLFAAGLLEEATEAQLEGTAELAALALPASDAPDRLRDRLAALAEEADLDAIYLVRADETVLAAVGPDVSLTGPDRAALKTAATADSATTGIQRDGRGRPFLSAFAPTDRPGVVLGVRASEPWFERMAALRTVSVAAGLAWVGAVALLGAAAGAQLGRPVARLLDATDRLSAGMAPEPPVPAGPVEIDALQDAFARMAATVHQRERRLQALAGAVAHEVRNPAHALRLHLGLLARDLGPGSPAAPRLARLAAELDALDATVDGFLVFAQDRTARRQPTGLRELLERSADGAPVDCPDVRVEVDPLLLGRATGNLVRNAREAGGEPVAVVARLEPGALVVAVEDAGPGFPAPIAARAFEPFVSGREGGSGLGLAVAAAVAEAHGGTARIARSGPGGTRVELRIALDGAERSR